MTKRLPTADELHARIKRFPGYTLADHAADLGLRASDLVAQRLALVRSGRIVGKGATRNTTWRAR